jgi:hypothetical protein
MKARMSSEKLAEESILFFYNYLYLRQYSLAQITCCAQTIQFIEYKMLVYNILKINKLLMFEGFSEERYKIL